MQTPLMDLHYNKFMGGTDQFDRLKLNRCTSLERNIVAKNWSLKLIFGLYDMGVTNSFIVWRENHPKADHTDYFIRLHSQVYEHGKFLKEKAADERRLQGVCFTSNCLWNNYTVCNLF